MALSLEHRIRQQSESGLTRILGAGPVVEGSFVTVPGASARPATRHGPYSESAAPGPVVHIEVGPGPEGVWVLVRPSIACFHLQVAQVILGNIELNITQYLIEY